MNNNKSVYFKVFPYRGDPFSESFSEIVDKSSEHKINTSIANIDTIYTLPIDKIVCVLDDIANTSTNVYTMYSNTKVLWDFGDGTLSTDLSAVHWYKSPGKYKISLTVFDKDLNAVLSDYNTDINVYNFVPTEYPFNTNNNQSYGDVLFIEPITPTPHNYILSPQYTFNLHKFNSWQSYNVLSSIGYTVQIDVSGNNAPFTTQTEYNSNAYSHLLCTSRTICDDKITNVVHFNSNDTVYVKYNTDKLTFVKCLSSDEGAVLAGTYQSKQIQYVDDDPSNKTLLSFIFDTTGIKTSDNYNSSLLQQWVNYVPYTHVINTELSVPTDETLEIKGDINITSCGLYGSDDYGIYEYKYINEDIGFILQLGWTCNGNTYPAKFINELTLSGNGDVLYGDKKIGTLILVDGQYNKLEAKFTQYRCYNGCVHGLVNCDTIAKDVVLRFITTSEINTIPHIGQYLASIKYIN